MSDEVESTNGTVSREDLEPLAEQVSQIRATLAIALNQVGSANPEAVEALWGAEENTREVYEELSEMAGI